MSTPSAGAHPSKKKRGGLLKAVFVASVLLVITTALVIGVFGPAIASVFAGGAIEKAVNPTIAGSVRVKDVSLSWKGPQRLGSVEIIDEAGDAVGTFEGETSAALVALASGELDLGALNIARIDGAPLDEASVNRLMRALASTAPPTGEPMSVPAGTRTNATIELGQITLAGATFDRVRMEMTLATGETTTMSVGAEHGGDKAIGVDITAPSLISPDGAITFAGSGLRVEAKGQASADLVRTLVGSLMGQDPGTDGSLSTDTITLVERDGVLTLEQGATVRGRLPAQTLAMLMDTGAVRMDGAPSFSVPLRALSIPLPDTSGVIDWRLARVDWAVETDPLTGTLTRPDGTTRTITLDPIRGFARTEDEIAGGRLRLSTNATLNGAGAGVWSVLASAKGLYADDGRLTAGGPQRLDGLLSAERVPSVLAQAWLPASFDADAIVGDSISLSLEGLLDTSASAEGALNLTPGQPFVRLSLGGARGSARASVTYDGARGFSSVGPRGVVVETKNGAALASFALGAGERVSIDGDGSASLVVRDLGVMLSRDGGLDRDTLSADAELSIDGGLRLTYAGADPVDLVSLRVPATLAQGDLTFTIDGRLLALGRDASITGGGSVTDALGANPMPEGEVTLANLPSALVNAFADQAGALAIAGMGPTVSGTIGTTTGSPGVVRVALTGEHGSLRAERLGMRDGVLRLEDFEVRTTRLGDVLDRLFANMPTRPTFERAGAGVLSIGDLSVDLAPDRTITPLKGVDVVGHVTLEGVRGRLDGEPLDLRAMHLVYGLTASGDMMLSLDTDGVLGDQLLTTTGAIAIARFHNGGGVPDLTSATYSSTLEGRLPDAVLALVPDRRVRNALREAAGSGGVAFSLLEDARAARGLGGLALRGEGVDKDAHISVLLGVDAHGLVIGPTEGAFTMTPALFDLLAVPPLAETPYARARMDRPARADLYAQEIPIGLINRMTPDLDSLRAASARVLFQEDVYVRDVASPLDPEVVVPLALLRNFDVGYSYGNPRRGGLSSITTNGELLDPASSSDSIALAWSGFVGFPLTALRGEMRFNSAPPLLDALFRTDGVLTDLLGSSSSGNLVGRGFNAQRLDKKPAFDVEVNGERLVVGLPLWQTEDGGYRIDSPGTLGWLISAERATMSLLGDRERAMGLRVGEDVRLEVVLERLALASMDAPLLANVFEIGGRFRTSPLIVHDGSGNTDDLGMYSGTLGTDETGAIVFDVTGRRHAPGPTPDGAPMMETTLVVNGSIVDYADAGGRATPRSIRVPALEMEGSVPTRLIDALGGMDGLVSALIGPKTFVDTSITQSSGGAQSLNAGFNGAFASGTLPNGVITPDGVLEISSDASITVGTVTNEASSRLLGVALPMFTAFEKSTDDRAARITTTGIRLPLNGDLTQLSGTLRIDPGTMRFETRAFLGRLLDLTNNNRDGMIGRRLEPFDLRFDAGVIRYDKVMLPLGEVNVLVEGRVNLKSRRVNTLVWVPVTAVSDDLAGAAARIPGVQRLTTLPLRVRGPLDNPEVSLDEQTLIEGVPDAILGTLFEDVPNGVGGLLEDLFGGDRDDR